MVNSTQPESQVERLQNLEINDSSIQASDLKTELLHYLVDVSRVFQAKSDDPESEGLIKKNASLISQLLSLPAEPAVKPVDLNVILRQKLVDGKVDLADEKTKELANKQVKATMKQIDDVIDALMSRASSFSRFEDKVTLEVKPEQYSNARFYPFKSFSNKKIYLRGLTFSIDSSFHLRACILWIRCNELPAEMICKTRIEVTIKNQADGSDFVRLFGKVYGQQIPNRENEKTSFIIKHLINAEEYEDESLGLMKDGKILIEVAIRVDELAEIKPAEKKPAATEQST